MDSLTQLALGAAVGVAVMGRRTAAWKSAAWGAVAGTLPDLDVLISHGDPVLDMVLHRAETHALAWLTLFSAPFGWLVARLAREPGQWRRWWLAVWAALVTHPLLDALTVYGTQLALPFSNHPFGTGSVFIIDPAYTLLLLAGTTWALASRGSAAGLRANLAGLLLSTAYQGWALAAQQHVQQVARTALAAQGIVPTRLLVTPAPLTTLVWRVVAVTEGPQPAYWEGFRALADRGPAMRFDRFDSGHPWLSAVQHVDGVARIAAFSKGLYRLRLEDANGAPLPAGSQPEAGTRLSITDLRMGQEPAYVFRFQVAQWQDGRWVALAPSVQMGARIDAGRGLAWLGQRIRGLDVPPPR